MEKVLDRLEPSPLDLQFFAEDPPPGDPPVDPPSADPPADPPPKPDLGKLLAKDPALKSQDDKMVAKAAADAAAKKEKELNMTAEQLAEQKAQEKQQELTKREAEIAKREMQATARMKLAEKGLPANWVKGLTMESEEAMLAHIDELEEDWRKDMQAGVTEQLKGNPPKKPGTDPAAAQLAKFREATGLKPKA